MQESTQPQIKNHILRALPAADFERMLSNLEPFQMTPGSFLYRPEEIMKYVYFPENAVVSIISTTAEGQTVEVGVIGREGMIGINVLLGVDSMPNQGIVQLPGGAFRMRTQAIRAEFKRGGALHDSLLLYVHSLMQQVSQTAVCNRLHSIEERLARWLLMCHDRTVGDKINLTQEFLSIMLGATRAGVTMAAITLQNIGYISYARGCITILDRAELEGFSCGCYAAVREHYDFLKK